MPWARLDDQFPDHPKVRNVGAIGLAIQAAAICYCARYLTDGFLSLASADALIRSVLAPVRKPDGSVWRLSLTCGTCLDDVEGLDWKMMLTQAGLWEEKDGGYHVHDYLDYNPSKREYMQLLKNKRRAGQAGGLARAKALAQAQSKQVLKQNPSKVVAVPFPSPSPPLSVSDSVPDQKNQESDPPYKSPPGGILADGFLQFWSSYPKKRRKRDAWKAWVSLKPNNCLVESILAGVTRYLATRQWAEGIIPEPHRFLRQRRWEDETPEVPAVSHQTAMLLQVGRSFIDRGRKDEGT